MDMAVMLARPVVVYPDTSDISRFADIGTGRLRESESEVREVYRYLRRQVAQGLVEVRYSGLHIAEITKTDLQPAAARRAQVIENLCGTLCFRPFEEIWIREVWKLLQSHHRQTRYNNPYEVYSNEGIWLFKSTDRLRLDLDLETMIKKLIKDSGPRSRRERRALKAQLCHGNQLSDRGLLSAASWPQVANEIATRFPVNDVDHIVSIFARFLSGRISKSSLEAEVAQSLLKPTQMVRLAFEMEEMRGRCPQVVFALGENVLRAIANLRMKLVEVPESLKKNFKEYMPDTVVRRPALEAALRNRHHVRGVKLPSDQIADIVKQATPGALPSADVVSAATKIYAGQHARTPRKTQNSDAADLLHLAYLPYCDVFRADHYVVDLLRQCEPSALPRVARNLKDLPALIEYQTAAAA